MRLRLRPLLVALSFLSCASLGALAVAWSGLLFREGVAFGLAGAAGLLGAAFAGWVFTEVERPGLLWAGGLLVAFFLATPVFLLGRPQPLVIAGLAACFGALLVGVLIGAARAVSGGVDEPGQNVAQVLGVGALGLATGIGLSHLGLLSEAGFDGLARGAGGLASVVAVVVIALLRGERVAAPDLALEAAPARLMGLGAGLGVVVLLGQSVLSRTLGESIGARPSIATAVLVVFGVSIALVAARASVDVDLGFRRSTAALGLVFGLLALLTPRLTGAFIFTEAVVRPTASSWLVWFVLRCVAIAVVTAPVVFLAGTSLGCSARDAVRTPANAGRWIAAVSGGAAAGWWLASFGVNVGGTEPLWAVGMLLLVAASAWTTRELLPLVPVAGVLIFGAGWSTRLEPATAWARSGPFPSSTLLTVDVRDATSTTVEHHRSVVRAGGHMEWTTGRGAERALLGVHAGVLTASGQTRSALVLGVSPGVIEALRAQGVAKIDLAAPSWMLAAAARLGVPLEGVTVHEAELREFLETTTGEWELIVMLPARPGTPSSRGLFTLEAWKAARRHLAPAGQLVQQLDLLQSNTALAQTALRTLRTVFPTGSTWGGAGEVSVVLGGVSQVLSRDRLEVRMHEPTVAAALKALELAEPVALYAWQVHTDEGQVRFAGPGLTATDRRPLLELGVPVASFLDEVVDLSDQRRSVEPNDLPLQALSRERSLGAAEFALIHRSLARHFAAWEPLVRSAAEQWAALEPQSEQASVAVARAALAQNDVASAVQAVLPLLKVNEPSPEVVAVAIEAMTAQVSRESAVFRLLDPLPLRTLGRETLARHQQHVGLREALQALEATP